MKKMLLTILFLGLLPLAAAAQDAAPPETNPVSNMVKQVLARSSKNIIAAVARCTRARGLSRRMMRPSSTSPNPEMRKTDVWKWRKFIVARAEDLEPIGDRSVDVVTTRSVLIYVEDKAAAFRALHRVLRPGGRFSIFEPINNYFPWDPTEFWGYDSTPVADSSRGSGPTRVGARTPTRLTR